MKSIKYLFLVVLLCLISCKDNSNDKTLTAENPAVLPSLEWVKIPKTYSPMTASGIKNLIEDVKANNIAKYAYKSEFETTAAYEARISQNPMPDQLYWLWLDHFEPFIRKDDEISRGNYCDDSVNIRYDADLQHFNVSLKTFNSDFENSTTVIRAYCSYLVSNEGEKLYTEKTLIEVDNLKQSDIEKIRASVPMPVDQAKAYINKPFTILLIATPDQRRGRNIARIYKNNERPTIETYSIAMKVTDAWIINWRTRDVLKKIHFTDSP